MTKLLPYQREGVLALHSFGGRALLADEMGLGKSAISLKWLVEAKAFPAVVVCPAGLKPHWQEEARKHVGLESLALHGMRPRAVPAGTRLVILNYEILGAWLGRLAALRPLTLIADECHYLSNLRSKRTRNFSALAKRTKHLVCISGTPLVNRPWELYPVLRLLRPREFGSAFVFGSTYCEASYDFGRWNYTGAKRLGELHKRLRKTCMVRRTMREVLHDLPPKRRLVVPVALPDRSEYDRAEKDLLAWLAETDLARAERAARAERYTRFTYLKGLAGRLKLPCVIAWVDSFLKESDGKLLVGTVHKAVMAGLTDRLRGVSVQIRGGMSQRQRQESERRFRTDPGVRVLIGNIKAAGVGLNLPEASTVLFAELPWTPGACQQFEARGHRLTSTTRVTAYYLVAQDTIESLLCRVIQRKQQALDRVLDGKKEDLGALGLYDELQRLMEGGRAE